MSHTSTYVILDVDPDTFADIEARLKAANVLGDYLQEEDREKLLVLGTLALRVDPLKAVEEAMINSACSPNSIITRLTMSTSPRANQPKWKIGDRKTIRGKLHERRQQRADGGYLVNQRGQPRLEWVRVDELIPPDGEQDEWSRADMTFHSIERKHNCYQEWVADGYYLIRRDDPEKKRIAAWHKFGRIGFVRKDFTP